MEPQKTRTPGSMLVDGAINLTIILHLDFGAQSLIRVKGLILKAQANKQRATLYNISNR